MTERERLIELLNEATFGVNVHTLADHLKKETIEAVADHLLSNGVIVPPCKVGDKVYVITSDSPTGIEETRVSQIKIKVKESGKISYRISAPCIYDTWGESHWTFCEFDFGKTVFLACEEAEKALREGIKNELHNLA